MNFHKKRLEELKKYFYPKTILDLGAYEGEWAKMAKEVFPDSSLIMIEANVDKTDILKKTNIPFKISLLGHKDGLNVDYYKTNYVHNTGNSIFKENTVYFNDENCKTVNIPMKTLDTLVYENGLRDIDFIKMDVQGSELNILKGASNLLKTIDYILIEMQIDEYNQNSPKFTEVFKFLNKNGYYICDLFEIHYNNTGKSREIDFLFVKDHNISNKLNLWDEKLSTLEQINQRPLARH